mgnify:CR=1 FL=1
MCGSGQVHCRRRLRWLARLRTAHTPANPLICLCPQLIKDYFFDTASE